MQVLRFSDLVMDRGCGRQPTTFIEQGNTQKNEHCAGRIQ